ncbi:MAG: putative lipoprotein signal peptide [Frankiales bacterium]|nr:putative lipoprotein signal peptide [Frankiales bacterium]
MYPTDVPEQVMRLGPYPMSLAADAPALGGPWPLVVVSHGSGGTPLLHRSLAASLARDGFVVALPEHPRNNRTLDDLAGTAAVLADRPRQLRAVVDAVLADEQVGPVLDARAVAVLGHSLGGYTGLACAGGRPSAFPHETADGQPALVPVQRDDRIRALVLLAPATPWFMAAGALDEVRVPILLLSGSRDQITPPWHAQLVVDGVPTDTPVDHRVIEGAGHYSFLTPFPPAMATLRLPPAQDPPGFDRPAFHAQLDRDVAAFLRRALAEGPVT